MKKLNITKERFEKSKYFQRKYGKLEYVSESGKLFKTDKGQVIKFAESSKPRFGRKFVKESYHGRVKVEASIFATGRTAEEALELLHNRLLDADAKIIGENEKPNPEIVDKYNQWFEENEGDVDFDICRDNNSDGFIQMDIKSI